MYFDRETVTLLRTTLDLAWASLPPSEQARTSRSVLAARILKAAAHGERDPDKLSARKEVESGKRSDRPKLAETLIAKLDRLSRSMAFVRNLMEAGVDFEVVDFPQANRLTIHILAAVAEHEAKMISERTRAALAAARGVKLGGDRGGRLTAKVRMAGCKARAARADARAADLAPTVADIQASGARSLRAIAAELNRRGIQTPRGVGEWKAGSVSQLLARLP